MDHFTASVCPTKICLEFSSGDTVDIEIKKLVVGAFLPGDFQIHTLRHPFLVTMDFLPLMIHLLVEALLPFNPWTNLY